MAYIDEVLADSPVWVWPLDDGSSPVQDASGNDFDGTVNGATLGQTSIIPTVSGTCALFDGSNDEINGPDDALLDVTSGFTLEAWVTTTTLSGFHGLISKNSAFDLAQHPDNGGNPWFIAWTAGGQVDYIFDGYDFVADTPTHIVVVFDSAFDAHLYIDGQFVQTKTGAAACSTSNQGISVGEIQGFGNYWSGLIQFPALYPSELSAARILAHYEAGTEGGEPAAINQLAALGVG